MLLQSIARHGAHQGILGLFWGTDPPGELSAAASSKGGAPARRIWGSPCPSPPRAAAEHRMLQPLMIFPAPQRCSGLFPVWSAAGSGFIPRESQTSADVALGRFPRAPFPPQ